MRAKIPFHAISVAVLRQHAPSALMRRQLNISLNTQHGHDVYTIAPRSNQFGGNIVYIHGGAYVESIHRWHWRFIGRMVNELGLTFTVPLYPLAPEHDCAVVSGFIFSIYRDLITRSSNPLVVMGDSAGGGLAMSLTMQAIAAGVPKPAGLVLLSPWLDVSMSDPIQQEIEKSDPLLMSSGLKAAGRWYAGVMTLDDSRVSPIHGPLAGLPPTLIFCGSRDILVADARHLVKRAAAEGISIEYHEEKDLMHVYPLMPFPESRRAQDRIVRFVREIISIGQP